MLRSRGDNETPLSQSGETNRPGGGLGGEGLPTQPSPTPQVWTYLKEMDVASVVQCIFSHAPQSVFAQSSCTVCVCVCVCVSVCL